jgi:hypothetical protein
MVQRAPRGARVHSPRGDTKGSSAPDRLRLGDPTRRLRRRLRSHTRPTNPRRLPRRRRDHRERGSRSSQRSCSPRSSARARPPSLREDDVHPATGFSAVETKCRHLDGWFKPAWLSQTTLTGRRRKWGEDGGNTGRNLRALVRAFVRRQSVAAPGLSQTSRKATNPQLCRSSAKVRQAPHPCGKSCGGSERSSRRPVRRRRARQAVGLKHFFGDHDLPLLAHLLEHQLHGEEWGEVVRPDRLAGTRM